MSEMQFDGDQAEEFGRPPVRGGTDFTGKLIKWGLVSTRQEAQYVMVGLFVLILIITYFVAT